ncbi:Uu.00g121890.m01.CDS01 [Anthostomella pinea]|uniref:Uu.00g121890.m01.CDS01 n=1 Tax=Anthostomella pinea TaxID=933095 RepID=A0AAI8VI24_9PEZI|nr:Uu.00g121890.m01.CDS01 [Anthostomella pinea]
MASQQDLQELIRLMTLGMKVPIKDAMLRVKALQAGNLRSIQQIAEGPLVDVEAAIKDAKAARSLHSACKARLKNPAASSTGKRAGTDLTNAAKRSKLSSGLLDGPEPVAPHEFEASLELPVDTDEQAIAETILLTNRAPLVLAFAVELMRYTMPEQPPSSRLSLAQAVVSANSRSKAVSIGLEQGPSADDEGWGHGQPRVRVMGREVTVLKRGGYDWKGDEEVGGDKAVAGDSGGTASVASSATETGVSQSREGNQAPASQASRSWSVSQPVTLKQSTFVVRATSLTEPSKRQSTIQSLLAANPSLQTATHNAWAYRVKVPTNLFNATTIKEESFDDGESGCGDVLLKNMRETNAVDTLVVMTRWYGGIMLGPDRWRIMRNCLKEALAERLRVTGDQASLSGEAVWGLDLEAMKNKTGAAGSASSRSYEAGVVGMPIHRPEAARAYLFKSFATRAEVPEKEEAGSAAGEGTKQEDDTATPRKGSVSKSAKTIPKRKTAKALEAEKEENVATLLGAIRLVYDSWADHLSTADLDRRAWTWYTSVRPEVESGPSGWGAKGRLKLSDILALRRKET